MNQDPLRTALSALIAERSRRSLGAGESLADVGAVLAQLTDPLEAKRHAPASSPQGYDSSEAATPAVRSDAGSRQNTHHRAARAPA